MNAAVEKIFFFRHGDYYLDENTRKQTLVGDYNAAARPIVDKIKRMVDPSGSIGFGCGTMERHKLSLTHIASELGYSINEPDIESRFLNGSNPNFACRCLLELMIDNPKSQYIICSSQGDVGAIGIAHHLLNASGFDSKKILDAHYSTGKYKTGYWNGTYINLKTGEFEPIPGLT